MRLPGRRWAKSAALGANRVFGPALRRVGVDAKGAYEYAYWRSRRVEERTLQNSFYDRCNDPLEKRLPLGLTDDEEITGFLSRSLYQ